MSEIKKEQNDDGAVAELIYKLADKTLDLEQARYDSLMGQSSRLLTAFSILSIAIVSAGIALLDHMIENSLAAKVFLTIIVVCLLGGLASAVISQFRKPYQALSSPETIRKYIDENSQATSFENAARQYASSLENVYITIRGKNNFILVANRVTTGLLMATLVFSFILLIVCLVQLA